MTRPNVAAISDGEIYTGAQNNDKLHLRRERRFNLCRLRVRRAEHPTMTRCSVWSAQRTNAKSSEESQNFFVCVLRRRSRTLNILSTDTATLVPVVGTGALSSPRESLPWGEP